MKRFTMIVALLLMVAMPMMAERVTPETAQKVAQTFLNNNGAKAAQLTDLSKIAGFPNLYIFTAEPGFVVMAADDCVQPILGYSLTGNFVAENMPENAHSWLQGYSDEIQYAIDSKMKASAETSKLWKDLSEGNAKAAKATIVVDALVQTQWDQDPLYNNFCPYISGEQTVTGCAATAMAQIMKYWEYPTHGTGSHSYNWNGQTLSANFETTTYDWVNMPLSLNGSSSQTQINAVATLMYHCGVALNMQYGLAVTGGSSAIPNNIPSALINYFNYKSSITIKAKSSYSDSQWLNLLKTELDESRPIQYNGWGPNNSGGHSFVCDGYDNSNYFHFNWGWSGRNDGFYSLSNLVPGSGGSGGGGYNFTYNQLGIFGIQPQDCNAATPTNFNVTAEGRNAFLSWDEADNAVSYFIYRNGILIASTTETTFTDSNLAYGTYAYYLKSRDNNGAASSPTATITVAIEPVPTNLTVTKNGNGAILNWTEPEWCTPQTDDEVLTYGDGSFTGRFGSGSAGSMYIYFGHKYPSSMLETNKVIYKVSFYATDTGAFTLFVYTANAGNSKPQTQIYTQDVTVSATGWNDIIIDTPIQLDATKDLWVFIYDPEAKAYPMGINSTVITDGNYCSWNPNNPTTSLYPQNVLFLIRTCITDGSFFYNLYDNNTSIATNLSGTNHMLSSIANNTAHQYTLKTNFNGGLTGPSNMAGLTLGTASLNSLQMAANDKMTVTENSKLTVTGTLSNDHAANLIIENGAQLIHNTEGVKATVKKTIEAYTDDDNGWNFIASPITESIEPSTDNGLLANNYDLYLFDQSQGLEWRNIKAGAFTTINHKTGYLYANSGNTTLTFAGTLVASAESTALTYNANAFLKGFNLIGNPYPCNTTVTNDFYIINGNAVELAENGATIAPCEGIFVKATDTDQTVTFSKANSAKGANSKDCFDLVVTQGKANIDRARVRLGEGIGMEKYALDGDKGSKIALWQEGQDFAVAYTNGQDEMPINFKATQNGMYSISIEANSFDLDYLHLIDNLTGNDVDLLVTPSYTFEAKASDYASRFRLLFAPAEEIEVATDGFAFFADGHLHIFNQGNARLQLIDMTGHILLAETFQGSLDKALDLIPGVYVVRLVSEKDTRSMKIVVD